MTRIFP